MIGETLNGRYYILELLGSGEHGQTYLAEERQTANNTKLVIKQFEPKAQDTLSLRKAKYLFAREVKIQKILSKSNRIPNLIANFREGNKFYLVHQYIDGADLAIELGEGKKWLPEDTLALLREILEIVEVAHIEKVIHQDIKPSNIVRRSSDRELMLIDFGSVKKLNNQMANAEGKTELTVPIGTEGYMAPEQKSIRPKLASDIYAIGAIAIYALTGIEPKDIPLDPETENILWHNLISVDETLATVIDRMVATDLRVRYSSATEALKTVRGLKLGKKLFDLKTIIGAGIVIVGLLGGGYYYWQSESSFQETPDTTGNYEAEQDEFPFLYSSDEHNMEMKYPFSWQLNQTQPGEGTIAEFTPQDKDSQSFLIPPEVTIKVDLVQTSSLEEYTTNAVYGITQLPQSKIADSRPVQFAGGNAHKVIYTSINPDNNLQSKHLQIWTIKGDRVYTITYQADLEQYDNFVDIVENEMLESVKIAVPPSP